MMTKSWTRLSTSAFWLSPCEAAPCATMCNRSALWASCATSSWNCSRKSAKEEFLPTSSCCPFELLNLKCSCSSAKNVFNSRLSEALPASSKRLEATTSCISWKSLSVYCCAATMSALISSCIVFNQELVVFRLDLRCLLHALQDGRIASSDSIADAMKVAEYPGKAMSTGLAIPSVVVEHLFGLHERDDALDGFHGRQNVVDSLSADLPNIFLCIHASSKSSPCTNSRKCGTKQALVAFE
mmetsp:Transcript_7613/g.17047  ORF Transcript_7613/g.17047 Transcript_7613/m.17047 type:complete len:241 (+) Transcript_7613:990-1712(+)